MRKLFFLFLFCLFTCTAFAETKTVAGNNGQGWGNAANWSPVGIPQAGDVVIIPAGFTISVKGTFYSSTQNLSITVLGTLDFDPSGKLDLGSGSTLQVMSSASLITTNGTGSEIIAIGGVTKYAGNIDGNKTGPIFASAATGTSPNGFGAGVLPVQLTRFTASDENGITFLQWQTATEVNTSYFVIELSLDTRKWKPIGTIKATGNQSTYSYQPTNSTAAIHYYRLKIVDHDAKTTYSSIAMIHQKKETAFTFGPNPAHSFLNILLPAQLQAYTVQIVNLKGQVLHQQQVSRSITNLLQINTSTLVHGQYFVVIRNKESIVTTKAFQVN